jgi:hypothetical protein
MNVKKPGSLTLTLVVLGSIETVFGSIELNNAVLNLIEQ